MKVVPKSNFEDFQNEIFQGSFLTQNLASIVFAKEYYHYRELTDFFIPYIVNRISNRYSYSPEKLDMAYISKVGARFKITSNFNGDQKKNMVLVFNVPYSFSRYPFSLDDELRTKIDLINSKYFEFAISLEDDEFDMLAKNVTLKQRVTDVYNSLAVDARYMLDEILDVLSTMWDNIPMSFDVRNIIDSSSGKYMLDPNSTGNALKREIKSLLKENKNLSFMRGNGLTTKNINQLFDIIDGKLQYELDSQSLKPKLGSHLFIKIKDIDKLIIQIKECIETFMLSVHEYTEHEKFISMDNSKLDKEDKLFKSIIDNIDKENDNLATSELDFENTYSTYWSFNSTNNSTYKALYFNDFEDTTFKNDTAYKTTVLETINSVITLNKNRMFKLKNLINTVFNSDQHYKDNTILELPDRSLDTNDNVSLDDKYEQLQFDKISY